MKSILSSIAYCGANNRKLNGPSRLIHHRQSACPGSTGLESCYGLLSLVDDGEKSGLPVRWGFHRRPRSEVLLWSRFGFMLRMKCSTILDHPESVIGIHLTTLESDLAPVVDDSELSDVERAYLAVNRGWDRTERGYSAIQSTKSQTV
jgi:hypothetical protein